MSRKKKTTVRLDGHDIPIEPDDVCDTADWWVCMRVVPGERRPLQIAQEDFCTRCGHAVWFDPRPKLSKPKKICTRCLSDLQIGKNLMTFKPDV